MFKAAFLGSPYALQKRATSSMVQHPRKHHWRVSLSYYLHYVVRNLEVQIGNEVCSRLSRKSVAESRGKLVSNDSAQDQPTSYYLILCRDSLPMSQTE